MDRESSIQIFDPTEPRRTRGWDEDRPREIYELSRLGLSDERMARVMGIAIDTLNNWKRTKPEFIDAMYQGKDWADAKVVAALYDCAVGYKYNVQVAHTYEGITTVTTLEQEKGPDAWAAARWLSLRQRQAGWSETARIEVTNTNINISKLDFTGIPNEVLLAIEKAQRKHLTNNVGGS